MGIPEFLESSASIAGGPQGLGQRTEESGDCVLPDLQPAAYVCVSDDGSGGFPDYYRADAGAFVDPDCSTVRAGSGPESIRRDEEVGVPPAVVPFE